MRSTAIVTSLGLVASWGFASLPLVSAQQKCFPLEANTLCGSDFIGYPVQMPSSQFDTALQAMAANSQALARSLQTDSGCTAAGNKTLAAVDTLRYQISMWCAGAVIDAIEVAKCQPTATAQRSKDPTILCSEQCNLAVSTMSNLLNNPDVCPPPTNANLTKSRSDRISLFSNYCSTVGKKDQSKCIIGVATEAKSCGFTTSSVAREQCQALTKDDCCNQLMGRKVADDGNNSILAPALGTATAIVVLVAVFITCCVCRRKRNRRNKNSASNRDTWPYNTQKPWENKEAGIYNNMNRPGDMHSKAPSPDFRDSWTPRGNFETQIDIKPPHSTYQSDNISMSPITTSTYTSQPSPVYHQEPLQPVSASQNVQVDLPLLQLTLHLAGPGTLRL
ncbi:uncharacterized protein SPPG_08330 [Spizellomyces punctatus DAOM BR117]|uniref:Extracellular membrane protein CFEM domain-containing protein n=1 Tax=Spizellomyces punctatus (strain DAOM BR117) TaxID=645134 RepID=A0A0L0H3X3_SPIPD|nr:uncharacterized protein SPPG_08330 [Spizellomyces punctatus DAOM BR117]KNC96175.1 hypothetical protein SPPG_08330 [Spizellomyces punctatus DAOM BR117]|eukprot:XP_016604215.1 hypothetical protein SPPG_08330 [Spizellomyces punctatus DAOM BR117]